MSEQVRALAANAGDPHGKRELIPTSCPLTSSDTLHPPHTITKYNKK